MQSNIIRCLSFFFFSIIRNFRNFREIFASLRRYKFYYCLGMDEWGRVLNYFRGGIFLLISGIHRGGGGEEVPTKIVVLGEKLDRSMRNRLSKINTGPR